MEVHWLDKKGSPTFTAGPRAIDTKSRACTERPMAIYKKSLQHAFYCVCGVKPQTQMCPGWSQSSKSLGCFILSESREPHTASYPSGVASGSRGQKYCQQTNTFTTRHGRHHLKNKFWSSWWHRFFVHNHVVPRRISKIVPLIGAKYSKLSWKGQLFK